MPPAFKAIHEIATFGHELLTRPGPVGAVFPSGRGLSRRMASFVSVPTDGFVIELGPGTGPVTQALLAHGLPPKRLILVELSAKMVRHLRTRFPALPVLEGDASELGTLLGRNAPHTQNRVKHVVSSLPLRSMPDRVVHGIAREIHRVLPADGTLIQFTYDLSSRRYPPLDRFERCATKFAWLNIPPARVDVYRPKR